MGCDIHVHTEVKIENKWHHYSNPRIYRDYELFAKICGVRNYKKQQPLVPLRGCPEDASTVTKLTLEHEGNDAHSITWLDAKEINELCEWFEPQIQRSWESQGLGYLFGNGWAGFIQYRGDYPEWLKDIRWVIWFDN